MARILLVDNEPDLMAPLVEALEAVGHTTTCVDTVVGALDELKIRRVDVVLSDMLLSDRSGVDLCWTLRSHEVVGSTIFIMVSARDNEFDKVLAFEAGADDYVTRPFSVRMLQLRMDAHLRARSVSESPSRLSTGGVVMDLDSRTCWSDGTQIHLTPTEWRLLQVFLRSSTKAYTRESLMSRVWGEQAPLRSRVVDTNVMRLRQKLGLPKHLLTAVEGVGYRWSSTATR